MKKFLTFLIICAFTVLPSISSTDKTSEDYLKNKRHFAIVNPIAECIAQKVIKKTLKKESSGRYRVKLDGYTLKSLKQGVFKYLEITGKNISAEGITIPYIKIKTISDYNVIDYRQNPPVFKTDMDFYYTAKLSENTVNSALKHKEYQKVIAKFNNKAYPIFMIYDVRVKIDKDTLLITLEYNIPIKQSRKNRTITVSAGVYVRNGKIHTHNIGIDNPSGNLPVNRLLSLINIVDPLSFTVNLVEDKNCEGKIEKAVIKDDIIQIDGRILIKKDKEVK